MARRSVGHARPQHSRPVSTSAPRLLALVVFLTAAFALTRGLGQAGRFSAGVDDESVAPVAASAAPVSSVSLPAVPSPTVEVTPTPVELLPIGIVAGHWQSDSGAVCDDWLREVDVNLSIAQRVVYTLRALGYPTDLLAEFDERLDGYKAQALVSVHADSCLYPEASGFKAARVVDSAMPDTEDRLVSCLVNRYQARTGLAFHEGSITADMTYYHAFYEIDPATPGVVIEVGFMLADRDILLNRQDLVAQGIVEGILCFIQGETP